MPGSSSQPSSPSLGAAQPLPAMQRLLLNNSGLGPGFNPADLESGIGAFTPPGTDRARGTGPYGSPIDPTGPSGGFFGRPQPEPQVILPTAQNPSGLPYPDLSNAPPVQPFQNEPGPVVYPNNQYPIPGGGTRNNPYPTPGYVPTDWARNAASGYGFGGRILGALSGGVNRLLHLLGVEGNTSILGAGGNYPDLSSIGTVAYDAEGYPIPGSNDPNQPIYGDWRENAARPNMLSLSEGGSGAGDYSGYLAGSQFGGSISYGLPGWVSAGSLTAGVRPPSQPR